MRAKKAKFKPPTDTDIVTDLKVWSEAFYEENPFYPRWPWGKLTEKQWDRVRKDNVWYRERKARKALENMEEALF